MADGTHWGKALRDIDFQSQNPTEICFDKGSDAVSMFIPKYFDSLISCWELNEWEKDNKTCSAQSPNPECRIIKKHSSELLSVFYYLAHKGPECINFDQIFKDILFAN